MLIVSTRSQCRCQQNFSQETSFSVQHAASRLSLYFGPVLFLCSQHSWENPPQSANILLMSDCKSNVAYVWVYIFYHLSSVTGLGSYFLHQWRSCNDDIHVRSCGLTVKTWRSLCSQSAWSKPHLMQSFVLPASRDQIDCLLFFLLISFHWNNIIVVRVSLSLGTLFWLVYCLNRDWTSGLQEFFKLIPLWKAALVLKSMWNTHLISSKIQNICPDLFYPLQIGSARWYI